MKRPRYGWIDAVTRAVAVVAAAMSAFNLASLHGSLWGLAWIALALSLLAVSGVDRLRQDLRSAALREET